MFHWFRKHDKEKESHLPTLSDLPEDVRLEVQAAIRDRDEASRNHYEAALREEVSSEMRDYLTHGDSSESVALYAAIRFVAYKEKIPEYELVEIYADGNIN